MLLRTHPVGAWSTFELTWPWEQTAGVAAAWFGWLEGLPDEVLAGCDAVASIPMPGEAESLNVAAAGAIALYQLARRP